MDLQVLSLSRWGLPQNALALTQLVTSPSPAFLWSTLIVSKQIQKIRTYVRIIDCVICQANVNHFLASSIMLIKKLAVPFINDKLLQQVEHCYIATAAISQSGFEFLRSRIPLKSKMEIVTGLDVPTSPEVLRRIWRNYHERITLHVYTRNFFHANVYLFDLPFRKAVAFVGSGHLTLEGLKDGEELFYKITDAKEIENLKSWFIGYYEFAEPLSEDMIQEYEYLYPTLKQRDISSRQDKEQFLALTTAGFNWDQIKFKLQYFKKEDFLALSSSNARLTTPEVQAERGRVQSKLVQLHELIKDPLHRLKLYENPEQLVSSLHPADHVEGKLRALWLSYGPSEETLKKDYSTTRFQEVMQVQLALQQKEFGIYLIPGKLNTGQDDREYFKKQMIEVEYRKQFFSLLTALGPAYWIEVVGDTRMVNTFQNEELLWEFTKADEWKHYNFLIGRTYAPGDPEISSEQLATSIIKELEKIVVLYQHMRKIRG